MTQSNTLAHMIAQFTIKAGHKPSAREIATLNKAYKYLEAEEAKRKANTEEQN